MPEVQESLADLVRRLRGDRSRAQVVERAARAGLKISGSYIARIEEGEREQPSASKLAALAAGLGVDPALLAAAAGLSISPREGKNSSSSLHQPWAQSSGKYPPSKEEQTLVEEAFELGMELPSLSDPRFWDLPPARRRKTFLLLEQTVIEERAWAEEGRHA